MGSPVLVWCLHRTFAFPARWKRLDYPFLIRPNPGGKCHFLQNRAEWANPDRIFLW